MAEALTKVPLSRLLRCAQSGDIDIAISAREEIDRRFPVVPEQSVPAAPFEDTDGWRARERWL